MPVRVWQPWRIWLKKTFSLFLLCMALMCTSTLYGDPVNVPDAVLEAAIEAQVGDNGIAGTVNGAWLLGQEEGDEPYSGVPGGLTVLGLKGENQITLHGVSDLMGLEHAQNLNVLGLKDAPVISLSPLSHLKNVKMLAFDSCGLNDTRFEALLGASFSLNTFALVNTSPESALQNTVGVDKIYALIALHPSLKRLALVNLGLNLDLGNLAGPPQLADPPCRKVFYLSGNHIVALDRLSLLYDAVLMDFSRCNIMDEVLAQGDWARQACLEQLLNLSANNITDISPLLGLTATKRNAAESAGQPVVLDLRENRLNTVSIQQHIPQIESAGWEVQYNMELLLNLEGVGDLPPAAGTFWHPYGALIHRVARPRPDSNQGFVGWQGDVVTDDYEVTVEMTNHHMLTAVFSETPAPGRTFYALHVDSVGEGSGEVLPAYGKIIYRDTEPVGLLARPEDQHYFGGWEIQYKQSETHDAHEIFVSEPLKTVYMNSDIDARAHFETSGHILNLTCSGHGTMSLPPGTYPLVSGAKLQLRALPESGWRLKHWEDGLGNIRHTPVDEKTPFTLTLDQDCTVHAVFEEAVRTLGIHVDGEVGSSGSVFVDGKPGNLKQQYAYGDTVQLTAVPDTQYIAFSGWTGDLPQGLSKERLLSKTLMVLMDKDREIAAGFVPAATRLEVEATVDGNPADNVVPGMTPLPGVYGFVRDKASKVELAALLQPGTPVAFAGWRGDLQDKTWSSAYVETVSMDRDRKVTAVFQTQETCKVDLASNDKGTITPAPGVYTVVSDRKLTVKAQPADGMCFGGWCIRNSDGLERYSLLPEASFSVTEDTHVTACFGEPAYTVWIGASEEGGHLTPPAGVYSVPQGTLVELEAEPPAGRMFYYWVDDNGVVLSRDKNIRMEITEDRAFNAVFGEPGYRVHIEATGTGCGQVIVLPESSGIYPPSSTIEINATPDADSVFAGWEGLPSSLEAFENTVRFSLTTDVHLTAIFKKAECHLTVVVEGLEKEMQGFIQPKPGVHGYLKGMKAVCFAAPPPDANYVFTGWEIDGIRCIHPESTFQMGEDKTVVAHFVPMEAQESVKLMVLPSQGLGRGVLNPLPPGCYHFCHGAKLKFFCELQENSFFDGFTGDYAGKANYYNQPVVLDRDRKIGARFATTGAVLVLGLNGEDGGRILPPPGDYRFSSTLEVVLQAIRTDTHWAFAGWFDGVDNQLSPYGRYRFQVSADKPEVTVVGVFRYHPDTMPIEICMMPF